MTTTLTTLSEYIAKQLNDHFSSPRGVAQSTYYTWTEHHIHDALDLATSYLYSIKPDAFATPSCHKTTEESCIVDLNGVCCKVLSITGVGDDCDNVEGQTQDTRSLLPLLSMHPCVNDNVLDESLHQFKTLAEGIFQFHSPLPAGTLIHYICSMPQNVSEMDDCMLSEYKLLLTNFALWQLLLTDNESRSNQPRWEMYYRAVQEFVQLKLRLEFSLRADDYILGTKQTAKGELDV